MKATEVALLAFLRKSPQFIIPIYQRTYSWTEKECRQLWDDILRAGQSDSIKVHFVGSIVYIEEGLSQATDRSPLLVIDGQQRLTTLTLLLIALYQEIGDGEPYDGFSRVKIRNRFLTDPDEEGDRHYKLLLSQTDRDTLVALIDGKEAPLERSLRVTENFEFFRKQLADNSDILHAICIGLSKLVVVDIALSRENDNPQLIFESMNSTGRELSQADLIRNFVLMGLNPKLQTRLYKDYWRPMELAFGQEAYGTDFDAFMRHYLTFKVGEIPRKGEVYEAFKEYARSRGDVDEKIEELVRDVRDFARYYCAMALNTEKDAELSQAFHDLRELKVDVAYPFLLELYDDYNNGLLSRNDFRDAVRLVESYVFRRAICTIPTNSLNKTFAQFGRALKKDRYLQSIKAHFLLMPSYRRFPRDDEFRRDIKLRDLYHFRSRSYWLRRLENHNRKERVPVNDYTIEHIMPQNPSLSPEWQNDLGPEWERIRETWLHTLGNLTLTGYNSEYSDHPFAEKRDCEGGFKDSPLRVNEGLSGLSIWNEQSLADRAERLAGYALKVWAAPELAANIIDTYSPSSNDAQSYGLEDHPHLLTGTTKVLFEAFRKEVLALDPCVNEEILKLYIAYKAERNFVDIIPQAKRILLVLNMRFAEILDPKGVCRDVTNLGRWGNGDVEISVNFIDEIPYAIGLARQALEQQLGTSSEE